MSFIEKLLNQIPTLIQVIISLIILVAIIVFKSPSHFRGSFSRSYKASKERIWLIISDRNIFREHRKALELVEDLTDTKNKDAKQKWKESSAKGAGYIVYQINRSIENKLLEVEMTESTFHMKAVFIYEIQEDPDDPSSTLVTITEESYIDNVIVKLIMSIGGRGANARRDLEIISNELLIQHEVYEELKNKYKDDDSRITELSENDQFNKKDK